MPTQRFVKVVSCKAARAATLSTCPLQGHGSYTIYAEIESYSRVRTVACEYLFMLYLYSDRIAMSKIL